MPEIAPSFRGFAANNRVSRSAETAFRRPQCGKPGECLCWRLLQYGLKEQPAQNGLSRQAVHQCRSSEAENAALLRPSERQAGMGEQLLRGEDARMAAFAEP